MNYDWPTFLASIGGSAGVMAVSFFIVKKWLTSKIEADVQHKYNSMLEDIKTENQKELEGFKAGYQKVLDENQVRFSWYYSEQAKAIKELYQGMNEVLTKFDSLINILAIESSQLSPEKMQEQVIKNTHGELIELLFHKPKYLHENGVFLDDDTYHKVKEFYESFIKYIKTIDYTKRTVPEKAEEFTKDKKDVLESLRKRLCSLLQHGVEVKDDE